MFYFCINKMKVIDNRTSGFLFFKRDLADVKIISLVTTGNDDLPDLDDWMRGIDPAKKKTLLAAAVSNMLASRILTEVEHVKDNQTLFFGDKGMSFFNPRRFQTTSTGLSWPSKATVAHASLGN